MRSFGSVDAQPDLLAHADGYRDIAERAREGWRDPGSLPVLDVAEELGAVVVDVRYGERVFALEPVQTRGDDDGGAPVDGVDRGGPLAHVERAKRAVTAGDGRVGRDGLGVDEEPVRDER